MKTAITIDRLNIRLRGVSEVEARQSLTSGKLESAILSHLADPSIPTPGLHGQVAKQVRVAIKIKMNPNKGDEHA